MKRILHVLRAVNGGMANHVQTLLTGTELSGFQHHLACPIALTPTSLLESAADVFELSIADGLTPFADLRARQQLVHVLHLQSYDVIHFHGYKALHIGSKVMRHIPNRPKVISTIHNFLTTKQLIWWKLALRCGLLDLQPIDHFITVSEELRKHFEQANEILQQKLPVHVIYNGIDVSLTYADRRICRRIFQVPRLAFVIGTIARLNPDKGVDILIRAMAEVEKRIPNAYLVVIGDGPERKYLETIAEQIQVSNIRWLGYRENADQYMHGFDLYVQPSRQEGFGLSVLEAMRASVPVIASRVGGLQEIIENQVSGCLVTPGDSREFAQAIIELYRDIWYQSELGQAGFERMQEHFSKKIMLQQWFKVYSDQKHPTVHVELSKPDAVSTHL